MKIQLIEAYKSGHHTNYIDALLPAFRRNLESGVITEVVITVTQSHYELLVQQGIAQPETVNLRFMPTFPEIDPNPSFKERIALFDAFRAAVDAVNPNAILATSADYDVMVNALFSRKANFGGQKGPHAVGVFHYGYPSSETLTWKEKLKQSIYETSWKNSTWDRFLLVNPMLYEELVKKKGALYSKLTLLPDPVPSRIDVSALEARQRLGIPLDGLYVGFVGMMDQRKAIPELLAGFVNSGASKSSRLLLAGRLAHEYQQLINDTYADLVANQTIIVINRHLSNEEIQLGYAAVDVHALLQYRRMNLSANLLKAVAYGKPILVDNCGYTGMMVNRFDLGVACDVNNAESINHALREAIEKAPTFKPSLQANRLVAFHHPDNYANTVINALLNTEARQGIELKTWDWVCQTEE